ncbi:Entericidin EcnAB [Ruegeria sp. TM1040]|nr:Entericidin EcnAB [Ruegeria sp. TM1040]
MRFLPTSETVMLSTRSLLGPSEILPRDGEPSMIRPLMMALMIFGLAACETTKGAGRDLQKAGQAISNTAQNVQNAI